MWRDFLAVITGGSEVGGGRLPLASGRWSSVMLLNILPRHRPVPHSKE